MTLKEAERKLREAGIENFRGEAAILAEDIGGVSRSELPFCADDDITLEAFESAVSRRCAGEPLQYIVGKWYFMNEVYEVSPAVLIPRSDTEVLVEWAAANLPIGARFADLGTGSGCIAISLLAARKDLTCVAVDLFPETIGTAKRNAARNGVGGRIEFRQKDILADPLGDGLFDAILSNPPYVTEEEYSKLDRELYYEPKCALCDGADGLTYYRAILGGCRRNLKDGGVAALEIGSSQWDDVSRIAAENGFSCEKLKDLSGRDRAVICKINELKRRRI